MKVSIAAAMTLCGRISPVPVGSSEDRALLERLRSQTDGSIIGAGTLREADPEMRIVEGILPARRIRAVITASGNISPVGKKLFKEGPPPLVFTSHAAALSLGKILIDTCGVISVPYHSEGQLSLPHILHVLSTMGMKSLLVEGGGGLYSTCISQGVVDEIYITIAPKLSGTAKSAMFLPTGETFGNPFMDLRLLECKQSTRGELFLRYRIRD